MTVAELTTLIESGRFHHATYRDQGTLWEGWKIYERASEDEGGFRGFKLAGAFHVRTNPEVKQAEELIRNTGYSVGSFGRG